MHTPKIHIAQFQVSLLNKDVIGKQHFAMW